MGGWPQYFTADKTPAAGRWTEVDHFLGALPHWCRRPGCYAIYIDGSLVYVGSSENLYTRLLIHRAKFQLVVPDKLGGPFIQTQFGLCSKVTAKVWLSRRFGDWLMLEARLIRRIKPSGNVRGVNRPRKVG